MKRTMVMVLALAGCVLAARGEEPPSGPQGAVIVKYLKLTHQTQAIPPTAVYTPTTDGLFRLSVAQGVGVTNPSNPGTGSFCSSVVATDLTGTTQNYGGVGQCIPIVGSLPNSAGYALYYFEAKANTPILYQTTLFGGAPVPPYSYAVAIVIEQLH